MYVVELIPYNSFQDRIKIVQEELKKKKHVEVWDKYIYSVKRGK